MKKGFLKKISTVCLALLLGVTVTGCAKGVNVDQDRLNTLMNDLQSYLDENQQLTSKDIKGIYTGKIKQLLDLAVDSYNYTYVNDKEVSRVEYTSDSITKVYHYTLDQNNVKTKEIYREIHEDYVYTYVKDLNLYFKVPLGAASANVSLLEFDPWYYVAVYTDVFTETTAWESFFSNSGVDAVYYNSQDVYEFLYTTYNTTISMTSEDFENMNFTYEKEEAKDIFNATAITFDEGDEHDSQFFKIEQTMLEFSGSSMKTISVINKISEGIPKDYYDENDGGTYGTEISFDKENTINFSTVGYELAK